MNEQVMAYIEQYPNEIIALFHQLRGIIMSNAPSAPQETLWARIPSYYVGESFVRLIPFKDHINIEAKAVSAYQNALEEYKVTPKGMLQIFLYQPIPADVLGQIVAQTLR